MTKLMKKKPLSDEEWIKKGVDIHIIRENLKLSYEERIQQNQDTIDFIDFLKRNAKFKKNRRSS